MQFTKDHKIYITLRDKNRSNNSISPANNNNRFINYIDNNLYLGFPKYYLPVLYLMKLWHLSFQFFSLFFKHKFIEKQNYLKEQTPLVNKEDRQRWKLWRQRLDGEKRKAIDALAMGSIGFFGLGFSFTLMSVFSRLLGEMVFGDSRFWEMSFWGRRVFFIIRF